MTMVGSIVQTNPVDYMNKWSRLCGQLSTMPLNRVNGLVLVIHGAMVRTCSMAIEQIVTQEFN